MTATDHALDLVRIASEAAAEKLATDIVAFDVSERLAITDAFVVCSAANDRQVRSVVDEVERRMREAGAKPVRREGEAEGRWVLLDYADVVVHVQNAEERRFYALERLWKDCPAVPLPESVRLGRGGPADSNGAELADQLSADELSVERLDASTADDDGFDLDVLQADLRDERPGGVA